MDSWAVSYKNADWLWFGSSSLEQAYEDMWNICDVLRDLAPFVKFKKCEKQPWRSVTFSKVAGFIKSNTTPWVFFTFF